MQQKVNPIVGVVIAILVVAVIGLGYMAMNKTGPPPSIPMQPSSGPTQSMSLPGMDPNRAGSGTTGSTSTNTGGLTLPGGGGAGIPGGGMAGAPVAPR